MKDTKRYIVFMGDNYYPGGGWDDYAGSFETQEEATEYATKLVNAQSRSYREDDPDPWKHDWYQVVDLESGRVVSGG